MQFCNFQLCFAKLPYRTVILQESCVVVKVCNCEVVWLFCCTVVQLCVVVQLSHLKIVNFAIVQLGRCAVFGMCAVVMIVQLGVGQI